jgi:hypothetical protein
VATRSMSQPQQQNSSSQGAASDSAFSQEFFSLNLKRDEIDIKQEVQLGKGAYGSVYEGRCGPFHLLFVFCIYLLSIILFITYYYFFYFFIFFLSTDTRFALELNRKGCEVTRSR